MGILQRLWVEVGLISGHVVQVLITMRLLILLPSVCLHHLFNVCTFTHNRHRLTAVTIPHRRHLSFWAKSSLFKNPVVGAILSSSGAIPVIRNPDNTHPSQTSTQSNLFLATTYALSRGEAVGVFPEGTSYTEPQIMQVKGGAGWAAVEYAKWEVEHGQRAEGGRLVVVPVGVVYTDKTVYRSRVSHPLFDLNYMWLF